MTSLEPRSDGALLGEFASTRSEAPFSELVRRHTPLVLGVCRRVLGGVPDAEDAAQAVFLTLAQKAESLRKRAELAGWLHRLAWNVSQNARRAAQRRRAHERKAAQMAIHDDAERRRVWERVVPHLDSELAALPETYRAPLILHHIEGVPHEEAAQRLGCRPSAYASRLSRAREMLRKRFARRGLAVTVGALAAAISAKVAAAEVPAAFVAATAKAGALAAAGGTAALAGSVSATAAELTQGALHMLAAAHLKAAAVVASAALLLPLAGYVAMESLRNERPTPIPGALAFSIPPERRDPAFSAPLYTGRILPSPHEVEYSDDSAPLGRVGILLGDGIHPADARVGHLLERLQRHGGSFERVMSLEGDFQSFICVGDGEEARALCPEVAPDRPEGYRIHPAEKRGKPVIVLKARDRLGLLWAITAFNQMVWMKDGRPAARVARVVDWPDVPGKRVYTAMADSPDAGNTWFAIQCLRPNVVAYRLARQLFGRAAGTWREAAAGRPGEEWKASIDRVAALLNPLGIEWYDSILPLGGGREKQIRSGSEEDFQTLLRLALHCADRGGHFCLLYDEYRFPVHPDDARDFRTAREADLRFVKRLFEAVRSKHPRFKLFFCPPFYWGPLSDPSETYGESRDEYLKAVGTLPEGIEVYWTGPRVKTTGADPAHARWFAGLIRRKPVYWQNDFDLAHGNRSLHYGTEPIPAWKHWYEEGFFAELSLFTLNESSLMVNMTLFDCLWNRKAYEPARSIEEANRKVTGAGAHSKLADVVARLAGFDPYGWRPSPAAARDVEELKEKTGGLVQAGQDLEAALPPGMARWLGYGTLIAMREGYLKQLLELPNLAEYASEDDKARDLAIRENSVDPARAVILTPWSFRAKRPAQRHPGAGGESRFGIGVSDAIESAFPTPWPSPSGAFDLVVCGLEASPQPCRIRITLNGHTVFEGGNPFAGDRFKAHAFPMPGRLLWPPDTLDNRLVVATIEGSDTLPGPPPFVVNYAVLRPAKR